MVNKNKAIKESTILFPGISTVYLNEDDALKEIRANYISGDDDTMRVVYKIKIDNDKGIPNLLNTKMGWNLRTVFDLFKLTNMMADSNKGLVYRLMGHVKSY